MFKLSIKAVLLFLFLAPGVAFGREKSILELKGQLLKRKKGFETYITTRDKKVRLSRSSVQIIKKKRYEANFKKKKARKSFRRTSEIFPIKAYRKFIRLRDKKDFKRKKNKTDYRKYKMSVRKIEKLRPYRINKIKGYRLE